MRSIISESFARHLDGFWKVSKSFLSPRGIRMVFGWFRKVFRSSCRKVGSKCQSTAMPGVIESIDGPQQYRDKYSNSGSRKSFFEIIFVTIVLQTIKKRRDFESLAICSVFVICGVEFEQVLVKEQFVCKS